MSNNDNNPSMEDILKKIRGVISGNEDQKNEEDVLDLQDEHIIQNTTKTEESVITQQDQNDNKENKENKELDPDDDINLYSSNISRMRMNMGMQQPNKEEEEESEDLEDLSSVEHDEFGEEEIIEEDIVDNSIISKDIAKESADQIMSFVKEVSEKDENSTLSEDITVRELVLEAVKPMLRSWLDDNLSGIVKSIISKEIKNMIPKK